MRLPQLDPAKLLIKARPNEASVRKRQKRRIHRPRDLSSQPSNFLRQAAALRAEFPYVHAAATPWVMRTPITQSLEQQPQPNSSRAPDSRLPDRSLPSEGLPLSIVDRRHADRLMTVLEAVAWTRLGRTKLYELIRSGEIPALKVGRRTLLRLSDLERWRDQLPRLRPD